MWAWSLAGRNDTSTSARGQSQPVEMASLATRTRTCDSSCTRCGSIQSTSHAPNFCVEWSPSTCRQGEMLSSGYSAKIVSSAIPTRTSSTASVDRYSAKSGLTRCPTTAKNGVLRRFIDSKLYLQVLSVLREDKIAVDRVPAGVIESFEKYMTLLHEN